MHDDIFSCQLFNRFGNLEKEDDHVNFRASLESSLEREFQRLVDEGASVLELRAITQMLCDSVSLCAAEAIIKKQARMRKGS